MTDDAVCLRRYAEERDQEAFSEFVRRNVDMVYSAAYRQTGGDSHLAEDIAQKVFVAAARKAAMLGRHPVVGAWLYQTTRYAAIDAVRSRQRQRVRETLAVQMTETNQEPAVPADWEQVSPELDKVVASLGERDREAVVLRFFGGKSFAEIGKQLELSEGAARMRVDRALEKLRGRLARVGVKSSVAALGVLLAEKGVMAAPAGLGAAATATALAAPMAGGLAAILGTIKIISSAKITVSVATVITLASLFTAVHQYRHARGAEKALAEALHARATAPATAPQAAPEVPPAVAPPPQAEPARVATQTPAKPANALSVLLDLLGNPAMQKQTLMSAKVRLDGQYSAFFKSTNLAPEQIEQFKNLLIEKQMVGFDSMVVARQNGIDPAGDPQSFFQVVAASQQAVDAQIATLLGPDGFGRFQQYQETIPARNTSSLLEQALSYTPAPLSDEQTSRVIQILTQHGTTPFPASNPFAVLNSDLGVIQLDDKGLAELRGVLSSPQLQVLQAKVQEHDQLLQARARMSQ